MLVPTLSLLVGVFFLGGVSACAGAVFGEWDRGARGRKGDTGETAAGDGGDIGWNSALKC